ncbi:MAG TPA: polymer-forming cytoskeletal protein [Acidisarcina sp.]|nr:polymer-forming cytoskeletal protein [Acidisarcina sp.]
MIPGENAAAVIGKSVEIRGEVKGNEDLVVDGHIEGTITLSDSRLTVGANARVQANVSARDVIVQGVLTGNILATGRVELRQGATLLGDIRAARLSIEENANFTGKVDLVSAPSAAKVEAPVTSAAQGAHSTLPVRG